MLVTFIYDPNPSEIPPHGPSGALRRVLYAADVDMHAVESARATGEPYLLDKDQTDSLDLKDERVLVKAIEPRRHGLAGEHVVVVGPLQPQLHD